MMRYFKLVYSVVLMCVFACTAQKIESINGNVYVSNEVLKNRNVNHGTIYPILALRIDRVLSDTLYIKYRFGSEIHMDVDFVYQRSCKCYASTSLVLFAPNGSDRKKVFLKLFDNQEVFELYFYKDGVKKTYFYSYSYKDSIDIKTHRDTYYAEDGFNLFR